MIIKKDVPPKCDSLFQLLCAYSIATLPIKKPGDNSEDVLLWCKQYALQAFAVK